ncbi:MAG: DASS family sodium-coupled anion symporter [Peptococcaceae bacterium]|nr:DASS family sodium-coupled anion symporter [Peptococcaceae bacterium]
MSDYAEKRGKRAAILLAIIALFLVIYLLPTPQGLSVEGKRSLALILCTTLMWMSGALPVGMVAMAALLLLPLLGLCTLPEEADLFSEPVLFFMISSYVVANALSVSGLDKRITLILALASHGNAKRLLFIIMMSAAILSMVLSDMGVVMMTLPIILLILKATGCTPGQSNYGKAIMIGLPVAALIGGMGTPAGSSTNVLTLTVLENTANIQISFLQWSCLGIPIVLILTPIAYKIVSLVYKPEITELKGMEDARSQLNALGALKSKEKKFIVIMCLIILVWLTESIHGLPIAITTTFGAILFFLPGIDILTWENTKNHILWDVILVVCSCVALGTIIWQSGAAEWIAGYISMLLAGKGLVFMLIVLGLVIAYAHLVCPVNPTIVSIFVPIACTVAMAQGINPATLAIPIGFLVSAACLIPLDAIPLVCYATGYFKMTEMFKSGFFIVIAWVLVVTGVMMVLGPVLGIM